MSATPSAVPMHGIARHRSAVLYLLPPRAPHGAGKRSATSFRLFCTTSS